MNKLIIQNNTDLSDLEALEFAIEVVKLGRKSETKQVKQYCFSSLFDYDSKRYQVSCFKNNKSDRFVINCKN